MSSIRDLTGQKLTNDDLIFTSKRTSETVGRFIIDTANSRIYAIPHNVDHPDFVAQLLGKSVSELKANPEEYSYFVSSSVGITEGQIKFILVGVAGFEVVMAHAQKKKEHPKLLGRILAGKIKYHTKDQLNNAMQLSRALVYDCEIPFAKDYSENVAWEV